MGTGFLPARLFMLDTIVVGMVVVCAVMIVSISIVRFRKNHRLHRVIQTGLAVFLCVAIVGFEIDLNWFTKWRELAAPSPYFASGWVYRVLWIHLVFAIPTPFVWAGVIFMAWRNYSDGYPTEEIKRKHRISGRIAAAMMLGTAITGWVFYWTAFVA